MHLATHCLRKLRVLAGALMAAALLAGCAVGTGQLHFQRVGPILTLHVDVYGDPGYQEAGLYAEYEQLHPNIKIVQRTTAQPGSYWQAVHGDLISGRAAGDVLAVPMADISAVTGPLAADFVPLNSLGGVAAGNSAFADGWLPWVAQQAIGPGGVTYALGAEIGPLATCYRSSLMAEAGLPTNPAVLARDWSTWAGFLKLGAEFKAHIPHGPAFTDSATSLYDAMAGQSKEQYYSQSGSLVVQRNPAIRQAWDTAVQAARDGLTAKLTPQSAAWDRGITRDAFAAVMCPAWMLPRISQLAGTQGSGGWNVTAAPGGAGNSGGFYLAIPRTARHQQAAFQVASFLTSEQAGVDVFHAQGGFPANLAAVTALESATDGYFSGARVGQIFGAAADRTPAAILGPASATIAADLDNALHRVETGQLNSASAWQAALHQATAAAHPSQ